MSILAFLILGIAAVFAVAAVYLLAFAAVAAGMAGWYKLRRRPDRVELLLATIALEDADETGETR